MKASKKLLSLLLVVMLLVSAIPFQALAAPVGVPVRIEKEDGALVGNDTLTVPDDGVTLSKELGDSLLGESAAYETLYWKSATTGNQLPLTETLTNATASTEGYSIKLVVRDKAPTPTTYTATLKATLDNVDQRTATESGVAGTKVQLTEAKAKDLLSTTFDPDKHEFKGWKKGSNAASAEELVDGNPTFIAEFVTKTTTPPPTSTYSLTVKVFSKGTKIVEQTLTDQTTVTLDENLVKSVYADFDTNKEEIDKWYENGLGETQITASSLTLNSNRTIAVSISEKVPVSYHNIKVYAVKYVGNVNKGVVSDPIFDSGNIEGTVKLLDYLNSKYTEIEANAEGIATDAKLGTNPTFYNNRELTSKVVNTTLTDASKVVYVRVDVPEVKNVLLYVHKGTELSKLTHLDPKVLHGYVEGSYVTYDQVQAVLGKNVKFYGLFTEERWDNRNASIKDDALPQIQVPAGGVEIHVWVTSGNVFNADPTNPKTGDYILDTAVTLMVISGLAAAAVYVIGKKRRV